jgi:hypothetical protein
VRVGSFGPTLYFFSSSLKNLPEGRPLTIAAVVGLALIIIGAEITLRGDSARRAGGEAKAHEYRAHPPIY